MTPASDDDLRTVDLPQGRLTYRAAGPATGVHPPVVFVHGLLVDGQLWGRVGDALAQRGIASYAPNLPLGAHRTPMNPDADLSPRGIARIVLDFIDRLGLHDVTLVGNDTGGAICQFLLDTDTARIGRLVLTNCDAFDKFPPPPFTMLVRAARHPSVVAALAPTMRPTRLRHSALGFGPLARAPFDAAMTRSWVDPLADRGIRRDLAKLARGIEPRELLDVSTRLGAFAKPVRLVWGDADRFFKFEFAERLADVFGDASVVRVVGGRTFLALDEPEQVADAIAASWDAQPERPAGVTAAEQG